MPVEYYTLVDILIDFSVCSHSVPLHVLKRRELVKDLDAQFVDEGIIIIFLVHETDLMISPADSIGGGMVVVVEQSACAHTHHQTKDPILHSIS